MKNCVKIILLNILIILILLGLFEFGLYKNYTKNRPSIKYEIKEIEYNNILNYYHLQPAQGIEYDRQPILLAGCSFAYGQELKNEQTLAYKLAHLTKRPVYNFSLPGKGLQHNLYFLQHKLYDKSIKNPQYYIYVLMSDQIRRLYSTVCFHDYTAFPEYKLNKKRKLELKRNSYPFYKQFYVYYFFNNLYYTYIGKKNNRKHSKLVKAYFREMKKALNDEFPDTKFVILFYGDYDKYYGLYLDELQKEGFIFIHTQDLSNVNIFSREYHVSENDYHPSEKAWDTLVPPLAKKLKL